MNKNDDKFLIALKEFFKTLVFCFIAVFLITQFLVQPVHVEGSSMYPTLHDGDIGFSNIIGMKMGELKRFDIVVIYLENDNKYIVKRIIGLPGETVAYEDDVLYINGEAVEEPFLDTDYVRQNQNNNNEFTYSYGPVSVGEDEYFVLGDNRRASTDSRVYGNFKLSSIKSKGVFVILPFNNFGPKGW